MRDAAANTVTVDFIVTAAARARIMLLYSTGRGVWTERGWEFGVCGRGGVWAWRKLPLVASQQDAWRAARRFSEASPSRVCYR